MCTVTWLHRAKGCELFFNRDELISRKPEIPANIREQDGVKFIAPLDGDANGTWILANESGLIVCIINRYLNLSPKPQNQTTSRGLLVLSLAHCNSAQSACKYLESNALSCYKPFTLTLLQPDQPTIILDWNGADLIIDEQGDGQIPLTTSSWKTKEVMEYRRNLYQMQVDEPNAEALLKFHATHDPDQGAWSVCMKREEAATKSFCHIEIDEQQIRFHYKPEPPDTNATVKTLKLDRSQVDA